MAAILAGIGPGDEVILPSYTFPSTANAFVLRGAVPVFVDIRPDTLNLDETKIGDAISPRTRAIVVVHYAGVCCEMDSINSTAREHGLFVIEDAAHATLASYHGRPAGSLGDFGALSFHETKNLSCGEGGALLVNDRRFVERAEVVRQKGTDRSRFLRREIDKYSWVDVGSSFVPSEINAAFLWAQMESADAITRERIRIWDRYHAAFAPLEVTGLVRRPIVPAHCTHTAHLFYLLLADPAARSRALLELTAVGIQALFHYVPLHDSVAGRVHGRCAGELNVTTSVSERLLRLPLWCGLGEEEIGSVVNAVAGVLAHAS
jgi:dTDP-4-amino-4,6-dideoxygalactose transaminase